MLLISFQSYSLGPPGAMVPIMCDGTHPILWHPMAILVSKQECSKVNPLGPLFFVLGLQRINRWSWMPWPLASCLGFRRWGRKSSSTLCTQPNSWAGATPYLFPFLSEWRHLVSSRYTVLWSNATLWHPRRSYWRLHFLSQLHFFHASWGTEASFQTRRGCYSRLTSGLNAHTFMWQLV